MYRVDVTCLSLREFGSPLGPLLVGAVEPGASSAEPGGVCLLELGDDDRRRREIGELEAHFGSSFERDDASPLLDRVAAWLDGYFGGDAPDMDLPLCTPGTRFQHEVWDAMRRIPLGATVTYGQLARDIGRDAAAARAVGAASGRNRVSILIPCHRVVDLAYDAESGGTAGLRGYGGGLENKRWLLDHERRVAGGPSLFESLLRDRAESPRR